jgi:outer membrane lipoprotein-sorting protein
MPLRIVSGLIFCCCALAAEDGSGVAVLRRAAQAYRSLRSESFKATVVMDTKGHRIEVPISGAIARPGRVRFEVINSMIGSQTVSDGRSVWKYVPSFGQYTRKPATQDAFPVADGAADMFTGEKILDHLQSAKLLRREKLKVNGKQADCDVIEATYTGGKKTFWVDVHRGVILRGASSISMDYSQGGWEREMAQTITVTSIRLNEPLRESLFVFVPPEGAREVDELIPPQGQSQNGRNDEAERE